MILEWTDAHLTWNASDYGGIMNIAPLRDNLWFPGVSSNERISVTGMMEKEYVRVWVTCNGTMWLLVQEQVETKCDMRRRAFPFDTQTCHQRYRSLIYEDFELKFQPGLLSGMHQYK